MSLQKRQIDKLGVRIRGIHFREQNAANFVSRAFYFLARWILMLYREFLKDEVKTRAESLSFLMMFSLLPLIAGFFFIFTVFTQFGMVQEAISSLVSGILETFPAEHRPLITEYTLKFKDSYLASISGKSGSLGIFALLFLAWIGLQSFNNLDRTINLIWGSESARPFLEKARNFLVVAVAAPTVLIASLSLPLILKKIPATQLLFSTFPLLSLILNYLIPIGLLLTTMTLIYRYVPVNKVPWRTSLIGGITGAVFLQLANTGISLYFKFGAHSPYGKAAIVPLIGFWIYVVWILVIMGAEVCYIIENEEYFLKSETQHPSLFEAECLLSVLLFMHENFVKGIPPSDFEKLFQFTHLKPSRLNELLGYLGEQKMIVPVAPGNDTDSTHYALARDISSERVADVLKNYLLSKRAYVDKSPMRTPYAASLDHWLGYFGRKTFKDFLL